MSPKCSTWVQSQKWQTDLCSFSWQTIQHHSFAEENEVERFCEDLHDLLELTPKNDVLFIIGDWNAKGGSEEVLFHFTWNNSQVWPYSTKWSRGKVNRALPRKRTGHSKHPLPTTQATTLHVDIIRWSVLKSDWLYSLQLKMQKLYTVSKSKTWNWLWLTANIHWIIEKPGEFQKNTYFCFIDYLKAFVWITTNCGKFLKRWEYQTTLPASCKTCIQVKKQKLELDIVQHTSSKLWKEYIKIVYCHPAYLTDVQSTSWEMPGWNQDCWEKYQWLQICRWHHPYGRKWRGTKEPLDEGERGQWKSWLKTQHSKNQDHCTWSHHFIAKRWGNNGNSDRFYFLGLQNHGRWWLQPWN